MDCVQTKEHNNLECKKQNTQVIMCSPTHILDTYKTFVTNVAGYVYKSKDWCLSCAVRSPGFPREILRVKWLRDGEDIYDQAGFKPLQMDLLIEVGM